MTLAYWCVLIAIFLPWGCAAYAKKSGGFSSNDNHDPRAFLAHTQGSAARANAAQQNSFEIFAPFAAAVIIAHATGHAAQFTINLWAVLFVISRIIYCVLYIKDYSSARSLTWMASVVCIIALFIAAI
ncbi:MAPEG family protein [Snodgrassella sp. CFCC 13594]|uniref:MAPEG family protein n=1 Tax=Snodgrassella sp. CFCC 13594 TaxID=1775559 RepID=UPI00082F7C3F|nr:MAPEG family protein [Snodgrassella sp. CFCC 13594]